MPCLPGARGAPPKGDAQLGSLLEVEMEVVGEIILGVVVGLVMSVGVVAVFTLPVVPAGSTSVQVQLRHLYSLFPESTPSKQYLGCASQLVVPSLLVVFL